MSHPLGLLTNTHQPTAHGPPRCPTDWAAQSSQACPHPWSSALQAAKHLPAWEPLPGTISLCPFYGSC